MTDAPERICPVCKSKYYARCDERREDGKFHPGSILRCLECKTEYFDPANSFLRAVLSAAEARAFDAGWNAAVHAAASLPIAIIPHSPELKAILDALTAYRDAIRALRKENTYD